MNALDVTLLPTMSSSTQVIRCSVYYQGRLQILLQWKPGTVGFMRPQQSGPGKILTKAKHVRQPWQARVMLSRQRGARHCTIIVVASRAAMMTAGQQETGSGCGCTMRLGCCGHQSMYPIIVHHSVCTCGYSIWLIGRASSLLRRLLWLPLSLG